MTSEEAISIMKVIIHMLEPQYDTDRVEDAVDMAIKALEQEPCEDATLKDIFCMGCEYKEQEPCEDCISRKDALNVLYKYGEAYFPLSTAFKIENDIKNIPSVQPKSKTDVLDKIRAEIIKYESDGRLSVDEYPSCKECTDNVFETIYEILDKYKVESEGKE